MELNETRTEFLFTEILMQGHGAAIREAIKQNLKSKKVEGVQKRKCFPAKESSKCYDCFSF